MPISPNSRFSSLVLRCGLPRDKLAKRLGYSPRTIYRWENNESQPRQAVLQIMESMIPEKPFPEPGEPKFRFVDLFAGIGGMRRAFEPLGGKCVFTSEWNTYAQQTYLANYECDHDVAGDITKIDAKSIPAHDVLLAGFPCQPFSIAGVSKKNSLNMPHGFRCATQGTLFFDVARILEHHRPKAFLLENVKNLISHDKGHTFKVIKKTLEENLGYTIQSRIIDAKSWVPQHRERIFIVGFREPNGFDFDDLEIPDPLHGPRLDSILHSEDGTEAFEGNSRYLEASGKVLDKYTLSDKLWIYLQNYARKHREKGNGFGCSVVGRDDTARTLSARYHKDGSEILVQSEGRGKNPRRLTPRECSRLMGFDRPGESRFSIPVSDTQAYRQFGNAVVVPAAEAVARHMIPWAIYDRNSPELLKQLKLEGVLSSV